MPPRARGGPPGKFEVLEPSRAAPKASIYVSSPHSQLFNGVQIIEKDYRGAELKNFHTHPYTIAWCGVYPTQPFAYVLQCVVSGVPVWESASVCSVRCRVCPCGRACPFAVWGVGCVHVGERVWAGTDKPVHTATTTTTATGILRLLLSPLPSPPPHACLLRSL